MSGPIDMSAQLAVQAARSGLYYSLYRMTELVTSRLGLPGVSYRPERPVATTRELLEDVAGLLFRDAQNVRDGLYPPDLAPAPSLRVQLGRMIELFSDLPKAADRRARKSAHEVAGHAAARGKPDYYLQNFHYQSGGYLTEQSARLYDLQVEMLFFGAADAMRRAALPPIARFMKGRDQRQVSLADAGCGTGRFIRQLFAAWPRLNVTGVDLSAAYLAEARRHAGDRRTLALIEANAEAMPLGKASQDIVTCLFLFHELPGRARRNVAEEFARVLKPGGLLVAVDSLQWGDEPRYDGLLESFPVRFHEPYYEEYLDDGLARLFEERGLVVESVSRAFLSKVVTARRPA